MHTPHSPSKRRVLAQIFLLGVILPFVIGCEAFGPPHAAGEKIYHDVLFASPDGHELRMDLYVPRTDKPPPVVLWIFGGSWKIGSKGYHVSVRDLTRYGIAVASIQYRLSGTAKYPAQIDDCRTALQWLRINGSRYGIDGTRIGVSGESAGGHLAALLGTTAGTPAVRAVFAMYPPTDMVALGREYANPDEPSAVDLLLGGPIKDKLAMAREASPVNHVSSSSPPFLLMHGAEDKLVPISHSKELNRLLQRAGVESRLIIVPDKGHWFRLNNAQLTEVARFFQRHLGGNP